MSYILVEGMLTKLKVLWVFRVFLLTSLNYIRMISSLMFTKSTESVKVCWLAAAELSNKRRFLRLTYTKAE